ncbi:MAG: UDP-N-acetylmuramoyl-L-alanine--D-glutamate ligase [Bacteroidia bacterium]
MKEKNNISTNNLITVLGAGESGFGSALLAKVKGFDVFVSDKGIIKEKYKKLLQENNISFEENTHSEEKILQSKEVIKSPGISDKAELIQKIKSKNIPVISEIEFAGRYTNAKKICITGSNGKTTTTSLVHHILDKAGLNVGLGGNIGKSFAYQVATSHRDYYVLELSSFQLDDMFDFKADIAILTNITPDHLDRYDYKLENYVNSKFRITNNQTENDSFIYCYDDEITKQEVEKRNIKAKKYPYSLIETFEEGAYISNNNIHIKTNNKQPFTMSIFELALSGRHNALNSMAAGVAARVLDLRKEVIRECLSDFQNIEHRLEFVARIHGIDFINDSKATNVNSTWYALENLSNKAVWIVGGVDKGNDYSMLFDLVKEKVKAIVCLGKDNKKIIKAFGDKVETIVEAKNAEEAVALGYRLAKKDETVILSPACASFDLFEDYEDRGNQFKKAVKRL